MRAFAFKRLPQVLKRQTNNYQNVVSNVAYTVHDVAGPRDGLAFLIERIENERAGCAIRIRMAGRSTRTISASGGSR